MYKIFSENETSKIDIYLLRISYIVQIGLFLLTALGFYLTVIPLYQKAILDEVIAKKEIELKNLQKIADESYSKIRKYTIKQFTFFWGPKCSGLLIKLPDPNEKKVLNKGISKILDIDTSECLINAFNQDSNLKNLNSSDYNKLKIKLDNLTDDFKKERNIAILKYKNFNNIAKNNPSILPPLGGFSLSAYNNLKEFMPEKEKEEWLFNARVHQGRLEIESKYIDYVNDNILNLSEIWNKE